MSLPVRSEVAVQAAATPALAPLLQQLLISREGIVDIKSGHRRKLRILLLQSFVKLFLFILDIVFHLLITVDSVYITNKYFSSLCLLALVVPV